MKNQILTGSFLLLALSSFGQISFTSNGATVTKAECTTNNLVLNVPAPAQSADYEAIVVGVRFMIPAYNNSEDGYFYSTAFEKKKATGTLSIPLVDGANESSLVAVDGKRFQLPEECADEFRQDQFIKIAVYVYGRTIRDYEWVTDSWGKPARKPIYDFTLLESDKTNFTVDFGAVNPYVRSVNKVFSIPKYHPNEVMVSLKGSKYEDELWYHFNPQDDAASSIFYKHCAYLEGEMSVDLIKRHFASTLLRMANPEQSGFEKSDDFVMESQTGQNDYIYLPSMDVDADGYLKGKTAEDELENSFDFGAPSSSEPAKQGDRNKLIDKKAGELNWMAKKIGNLNASYVELDFYQGYQIQKDDKSVVTLKSGEKGKTSKLWFYVGEQNGRTHYGYIMQRGKTGSLSEKEAAFVKRILAEFKVL